MDGWTNQCPVASGIVDPSSDRRRAVDLVHASDETVRLVELKWASDTPAYALFQVLEYGLAYVFARLHRTELGLERRRLLHASEVRLEVIGPAGYFAESALPAMFEAASRALARLAAEKTGGALTMSLHALRFPAHFDQIPFASGKDVKAKCRGRTLTDEGRRVCDAFAGLAPVVPESPRPSARRATSRSRFLPGVPGAEIERALAAAPGNEIGRRKFDHPESSAALAVNAFGFFLPRAGDLPALPGCERSGWPARSLSVETTVRFPWRGGRHPVLDCLVATGSALIGVESKRYEPFRERNAVRFSSAYWRDVWGSRMAGYESVRDALRRNPRQYAHLDAAQLVKHAFALRTEVHRQGPHHRLRPALLYVYAEPEVWVRSGRPVGGDAKAGHAAEIAAFGRCVAGDEVSFIACSYRRLLDTWSSAPDTSIRAHAHAVKERFSP